MSSYDDVMAEVEAQRSLGEGYELREVKRWTVHCSYCGTGLMRDTPRTDRAFAALKRQIEIRREEGRRCRNKQCVSNGGTERRRAVNE